MQLNTKACKLPQISVYSQLYLFKESSKNKDTEENQMIRQTIQLSNFFQCSG